MKMFVHLWQYVAEFLLEWENLQIKVIKNLLTYIYVH
jgi:hypothetical protein